MSFKIISAEERLKNQSGVKMIIVGGFGIGKTSLLKTLEEPMLCIDMEAGLLAVQDWEGSTITIRTWPEARDCACLIGGPNPALRKDQPYSERHYEKLKAENDIDFEAFPVIFMDSLTVASRLCFNWCRSEMVGKADVRMTYSLLAQEMMAWLEQFQHVPHKDVIFVGLLEPRTDEFQKQTWHLQCEGNKMALEIPGILDEVISMIADQNGNRIFVCPTLNPLGYPAKDRSGRLDVTEPAHLGNLLKKIREKKTTEEKELHESKEVTKETRKNHD
ncbi:hypothetical protein AGMMS49949_03070 [Alphaproteobacteria bacterium]|nr:hypothetical protein AGMMS49949_03070 [Alphaproteobacteria bacterium]GHS97956.1 hypothetical protein AGMMS50296_5320 [Alphaproteobacteria bacterium]